MIVLGRGELPAADLGRLLPVHPRSQDHPATYVPQPLCLPSCGLAHSTLIFVPETLVVVRPWGQALQVLGINPAEACSAGREGTEQSCSWFGGPPGPPQIELQPVPGVSQGCAWGREGTHQGLFTEAGCGTAWLLQCPPPSPLLLAFLSSPRAIAWLGLWTFFPMDPE